MTTTLKVVAGLGNPGTEYECTRHNAGFWFVDELARRSGESFRSESRFNADICRVRIAGESIWLIKPMTYMNRSGGPLRQFLDYYKLPVDALLVAHDEIDLPVGDVRLKEGGGHGGHNGLRDSIACLGAGFYRLRIGVAHPGSRDEVVSYVLRKASAAEQTELDTVVDKAADVVPIMVADGFPIAMNKINRRARKKRRANTDKQDGGANNGD
ncbi:MAG: aminoacyl-tRNA hydrolase [Pseudomonadota bacterium]